MKTIEQQKEILEQVLSNKNLVESKDEIKVFLIPKWELMGNTYGNALEKILESIKSSRPFYNWIEGKLESKYLRESKEKIEYMKKLKQTEDGRFYIVEVQLGQKWKGKSVKNVRENYSKNEFGLGAFEVCSILLTHPEILKSHDDLWLDCPGDEFDPGGGGGFSLAPYLRFRGDGLGFGTGRVCGADDRYGSVSGFSSQ